MISNEQKISTPQYVSVVVEHCEKIFTFSLLLKWLQ